MVAIHYAMAAILVCAVSVSARHHHPEPNTELAKDTPIEVEEHDAATDSRRHRRKRWYSSYGFQQPSYRDDNLSPGSAPYDPFSYIYKRLDELAALIRQPQQSVSPSPIFVPYPLYYPPGCGCGPTSSTPAPGPAPTSRPTGNTTDVVMTEQRFGADGQDDYDDMPLRPLTFEPVEPDRPLSRPVPSVEHGSSQAGAPATGQQGREPVGMAPPAPRPAGFAQSAQGSSAPSTCDFAILTCCHQRYTTNKCFEDLRCPNALRNGNPCNSRTLTNVVSLFQDFYRTQN